MVAIMTIIFTVGTYVKADFQLRRGSMSSFVDRANQLHSAGFSSIDEIVKARPVELVGAVEHLSYEAAMVIIQVSIAQFQKSSYARMCKDSIMI